MMEDDESALFKAAVGQVEPLKDNAVQRVPKDPIITPGVIERRKAAAAENATLADGLVSEEYVTMLDPHEVLAFKRDGVQHGVYKNLRLGRYPVESGIDLHRMTVIQAREIFWRFVRDCVEYEIRCALINHGKGIGRAKPALLKSCVNHWLQQQDSVLAFHSATPAQGGAGATFVLFKKGDAKKNANRERFGVRSS